MLCVGRAAAALKQRSALMLSFFPAQFASFISSPNFSSLRSGRCRRGGVCFALWSFAERSRRACPPQVRKATQVDGRSVRIKKFQQAMAGQCSVHVGTFSS